MSPILTGVIASGISGNLLTNSFESIATFTLTGNSTGITFSSIPSTYKHLQLRMFLRGDRNGGDDLNIKFNSDTGNNYSDHVMGGDGANTAPYGQAPFGFIYSYQGFPGAGTATGLFYGGIMDIVDYQNTSKNKTIKMFQGYDNNGGGNVQFTSGSWMNTAAINNISIAPRYGTNFVQYSQIALYGIKG